MRGGVAPSVDTSAFRAVRKSRKSVQGIRTPKTRCRGRRSGVGGLAVKPFKIAGLVAASDIELPGLLLAEDDASADVVIRSGVIPEVLDGAVACGPTWQLSGETLLLEIPDVARFLICGGREIVYQPLGRCEASDLTVFLAGPAMALLLELGGRTVFRASAVEVNGKAVLFCGPSGSGKSTLAAALAQRGYRVLLDDVCAPSLGSPPLVQPDAAWLKLWSHAIGRLGAEPRRGARVRQGLGKHYLDPGPVLAGPTPVGAVYNLGETRPPLVSGITSTNSVDAVLLVRRSGYHPLLARKLDRNALYFQAAAAIAHSAGVFHLTRPFDFDALPETMEMLERHWSEIGLLEAAA